MKESQIKALAEGGLYQRKVLHGTLEETHISWIILTSRFAFKIKKPLKFSFLDFSTLARRKKYCARELVLNRRFSNIYLAVVPLRYHGLKRLWYIGKGPGTIIDYAVVMKRMRSSKRMDAVLRSGQLTDSNVLALAKCVGLFHAGAKAVTSPFSLERSRDNFNDIRDIRRFVKRTLPEAYESIVTNAILWSNQFLTQHALRLQERIALGFKRDVHGDLHSGNIFLYRRPVIFDCIEFNDAYRQIDVLDEIAFLCMDLESFGQAKYSALFIKEYSRIFPCFFTPEDINIFNYFKCYRANVRAKVHALATEEEDDPVRYAGHVSAVKKYLQLMKKYIGDSWVKKNMAELLPP
ncbi:MAG TPA: hypothetical protein VFO54_08340 [Chryseosolibacter sp.]|nr:hypothetical protein [Chryseosolibacter sp.]